MAEHMEGGLGFPSLLGPPVLGACEGRVWKYALYGLIVVAFLVVAYVIWKGMHKEHYSGHDMEGDMSAIEYENAYGQPEYMYDPIETEVESGQPEYAEYYTGGVGPKVVNNEVGPGDLQRMLY